MRVEIIPNFASKEEIALLNAWAELGVKNKWLDTGMTNYVEETKKRLTSRFYANRYIYSDDVLNISKRVRKFLGLDLYPLITGHGRDGIVVSYTYQGGDVYKHKDPPSVTGLATLRCNILTQAPEAGGDLYIEGCKINFNMGDLHCYLVSEHEHWATEVKGNTPRIMWMFGAHVPADDWNSGKIKVTQ